MHTLDLRGMILPFVLLKVSNAFKEMRIGESLEILLGDPDSVRDLLKILPPLSYELTAIKKNEEEDIDFCIQLLKKQPKKKENTMSNLDLSTIKVSNTVDARGSACPGPLLEAKKGIGKVKVGEILEIYSKDCFVILPRNDRVLSSRGRQILCRGDFSKDCFVTSQ